MHGRQLTAEFLYPSCDADCGTVVRVSLLNSVYGNIIRAVPVEVQFLN